MKDTYTIKASGPPKFHIGCDYTHIRKGDNIQWVMGRSTYIIEFLRKVCALLKFTTLRKEKLPCSPGDHSELDLIPLMCEVQHRLYRQLVGMVEWAVQIRRFDIHSSLTSLNRFLASPREGHFSRLVNIFDYLQSVTGRRKIVFISP